MSLPQIEQALALAEMARERCRLSSSSGGKSGVMANPGLLPLTLAWEGSALALLASRGISPLSPQNLCLLPPSTSTCSKRLPYSMRRMNCLGWGQSENRPR